MASGFTNRSGTWGGGVKAKIVGGAIWLVPLAEQYSLMREESTWVRRVRGHGRCSVMFHHGDWDSRAVGLRRRLYFRPREVAMVLWKME
jgi:hypothetical protein